MQTTTALFLLQKYAERRSLYLGYRNRPSLTLHDGGRVTIRYGWFRKEVTTQAVIAQDIKLHFLGRPDNPLTGKQ